MSKPHKIERIMVEIDVELISQIPPRETFGQLVGFMILARAMHTQLTPADEDKYTTLLAERGIKLSALTRGRMQ